MLETLSEREGDTDPGPPVEDDVDEESETAVGVRSDYQTPAPSPRKTTAFPSEINVFPGPHVLQDSDKHSVSLSQYPLLTRSLPVWPDFLSPLLGSISCNLAASTIPPPHLRCESIP
ncbi:hypothetical protein DPEC_G00200500 [Dallia pectoralis]|uniref:Uncharacterized protein n=1 Tax=Dallia pectoralis TaxID=75939 RepID=A0ACC2G8W3_DALPE|nr:hypothetical protein DPEC_G00200500 [Dallia pectoralis]